jgi:hypothetical protein
VGELSVEENIKNTYKGGWVGGGMEPAGKYEKHL